MAGTARVLDWVHLRHQAAGDVDLMREVLGLFLEQGEKVVTALETVDDLADWKLHTHTLKGSARGIGAFEVAAAAELCEQAPLDRSNLLPLRVALAAARSAIADAAL